MDHRRLLPLILACITGIGGCDSGEQQGQFFIRSSGGERLANDSGWIATFKGTSRNELNAPDRLLIAVVLVGPGINPTGSSHDTYLSTEEIKTPSGTFNLTWDRRSDIVSIQEQRLDRKNGNIIVVRNIAGKVIADQVPIAIESYRTADILNAVKAALPKDAEIQNLSARSTD